MFYKMILQFRKSSINTHTILLVSKTKNLEIMPGKHARFFLVIMPIRYFQECNDWTDSVMLHSSEFTMI